MASSEGSSVRIMDSPPSIRLRPKLNFWRGGKEEDHCPGNLPWCCLLERLLFLGRASDAIFLGSGDTLLTIVGECVERSSINGPLDQNLKIFLDETGVELCSQLRHRTGSLIGVCEGWKLGPLIWPQGESLRTHQLQTENFTSTLHPWLDIAGQAFFGDLLEDRGDGYGGCTVRVLFNRVQASDPPPGVYLCYLNREGTPWPETRLAWGSNQGDVFPKEVIMGENNNPPTFFSGFYIKIRESFSPQGSSRRGCAMTDKMYHLMRFLGSPHPEMKDVKKIGGPTMVIFNGKNELHLHLRELSSIEEFETLTTDQEIVIWASWVYHPSWERVLLEMVLKVFNMGSNPLKTLRELGGEIDSKDLKNFPPIIFGQAMPQIQFRFFGPELIVGGEIRLRPLFKSPQPFLGVPPGWEILQHGGEGDLIVSLEQDILFEGKRLEDSVRGARPAENTLETPDIIFKFNVVNALKVATQPQNYIIFSVYREGDQKVRGYLVFIHKPSIPGLHKLDHEIFQETVLVKLKKKQ